MGAVKTERHDDHEINELAKKIAEQNRVKMTAMPQGMPGYPGGMHPMTLMRPGQPGISNFMMANGSRIQMQENGAVAEEKRIDDESRKGRFGWCEFEKNFIPYIFRNKGEKYTSVRMVERKLLSKFLTVLPTEVNTCHCIRSYYITDAECKLLNEINLKHADCHFGKEAFTSKDLVVRLSDAKEFYHFLDLCYKKLVLKRSNSSDRCGFFRINGESVVPYTVTDGNKFVPLFYFEGETDHLKLKSETVDGWDLAYLKFCCKVQGIRNELFASETCRVVALEEIKQHFPQGTTFEDYWPAKGSIEPVHAQRISAGNWTQRPATAAAPTPSVLPPAKPSIAPVMPQQQYNPMATVSTSRNAAVAAAAAAAAAAVNNMTAYDVNAFQQLLRSGMMQSVNSNTAAAAAAAQSQQRAVALQQQQLMRAAAQQAAAQQAAAYAHAASLHQQQQQQLQREKVFNGKLTQIKEFPMDRSHQPPYKLQKALIDQKIVPCINVRPYVFHDLMMTLPDFVRHFYPDLTIEKARQMLQDILNVVLYKGNSGHQEVLRNEGKCSQFDPVPLVLVKDIMNYMPQMKYMINNMAATATDQPASKRLKVS